MTLQQVAYSEAQKLPIITRKSTTQAFLDAVAGKAPEQPHGERDPLIAEGFIAQEDFRRLGVFLQQRYKGSVFQLGPDKDLQRAIDKKGNLQLVMDILRGWQLIHPKDVPLVIQDFGERKSLLAKSLNLEFTIVDVDNTFIKPNPKKPGYRVLDTKLLFETELEHGINSYHIAELQFILKGMEIGFAKSHSYYEEARMQQKRKQYIENAMDMVEKRSGTAFNRLRVAHADAIEKFNAAMEQRGNINEELAEKHKVDAIIKGQVCTPCNDDFVVKPIPGAYIVPVVN